MFCSLYVVLPRFRFRKNGEKSSFRVHCRLYPRQCSEFISDGRRAAYRNISRESRPENHLSGRRSTAERNLEGLLSVALLRDDVRLRSHVPGYRRQEVQDDTGKAHPAGTGTVLGRRTPSGMLSVVPCQIRSAWTLLR